MLIWLRLKPVLRNRYMPASLSIKLIAYNLNILLRIFSVRDQPCYCFYFVVRPETAFEALYLWGESMFVLEFKGLKRPFIPWCRIFNFFNQRLARRSSHFSASLSYTKSQQHSLLLIKKLSNLLEFLDYLLCLLLTLNTLILN